LRLRWVAHVRTPRRYARGQAKFDRYGNRLLFAARFIPLD
jgi:membrane protein DedA with SNARE-associated domain